MQREADIFSFARCGSPCGYSATTKTRYVGSAFCFNNEGIFKGFDCF